MAGNLFLINFVSYFYFMWKRNSGQSSTEYLVTYGWAIIGVLIIGLAIWQTGLLEPPAVKAGKDGFHADDADGPPSGGGVAGPV